VSGAPHTLIWAEGMTGAKALAPALRAWRLAEARKNDVSLSAHVRGAAMVEAEQGEAAYAALVAEAETSLKAKSAAGKVRTHMLIVGVGQYSDRHIPPVTTSIHGATAFADWALNRFQHLDRPLGSVAMLLSPPDGMGSWKPSEQDAPVPIHTATRLGLRPGDELPLAAATFANIKSAFGSMVARGCTARDNAVIFYFSGHGLWKVNPYALPEDAVIPDAQRGIDNFIDTQATMNAMVTTLPETQVFVIDTCQEILPKVMQNVSAAPGQPLWEYASAGIVPRKDSAIYFGAYPGQSATGQRDQAPFFTQEFLACLERRGVNNRVGKHWEITTSSLARALQAASIRRSEHEGINLVFSTVVPGATFNSVLCHVETEPEVLLRVRCRPGDWMSRVLPYVTCNGKTERRLKPSSNEWVTCVGRRSCHVGADAVPPDTRAALPAEYDLHPPVEDVTLDLSEGVRR
jgi:hypothetical protein